MGGLLPAAAHQVVGELVPLPHKHAARHCEVAVEPGVPQSAPVGLHIDHLEARLLALGFWLQLQARAAAASGAWVTLCPGCVQGPVVIDAIDAKFP